jgi:trans-2,3-dihydro-3-hydroxyanthranilate isomerase
VLVTIVDACLRDGRGGSPTAVVHDAALTAEEGRAVARLAGTSHAVLVSTAGRGEDRPSVSLRFFTATGELPGCGHGTVAALAVLAEDSGHDAYRATLRAGGRELFGEALRDGHYYDASFDPGAVQLRDVTASERDLVGAALGDASELDMSGICVAALGRPRLLVPLLSAAALPRITPSVDTLRAGCDRLDLLGCYVHTPLTDDGRLAARMFAPSIGVPEDIANANSTACLAARALGPDRPSIRVDMGDSLGAPATITATLEPTRAGSRIRVGGRAAIVERRGLVRRELRTAG